MSKEGWGAQSRPETGAAGAKEARGRAIRGRSARLQPPPRLRAAATPNHNPKWRVQTNSPSRQKTEQAPAHLPHSFLPTLPSHLARSRHQLKPRTRDRLLGTWWRGANTRGTRHRGTGASGANCFCRTTPPAPLIVSGLKGCGAGTMTYGRKRYGTFCMGTRT